MKVCSRVSQGVMHRSPTSDSGAPPQTCCIFSVPSGILSCTGIESTQIVSSAGSTVSPGTQRPLGLLVHPAGGTEWQWACFSSFVEDLLLCSSSPGKSCRLSPRGIPRGQESHCALGNTLRQILHWWSLCWLRKGSEKR